MVIRVSNVSISFSLSSMDHLAKASPKILNKTVGATFSETVVRRCSLKNFFIFFFQNSQENTCAGVSLLIQK